MVRQATVIIALSLVFSTNAESTTRRLAVVVGANSGATFQVRLRHAGHDAKKFALVLQDLGDTASVDLKLLADEPTADAVSAALDWAEAQSLKEVNAGHRVELVFYYSGHSTQYNLQLSGTQLPLSHLRRRLKESKATIRVGIIDACHSGMATRLKGGKRTKKVAFSQHGALAKGYAILTSSAAGEKSQESDELLGSFFTHHLVSALRGAADSDANGIVTLAEAYKHSYEKTLHETVRASALPQHPHFDMALKGAQDVVLTRLKRASSVVTVAASRAKAQWVIFEPSSGMVVAEVQEKSDHITHVAVPQSKLEIYRREGGNVARMIVDTRGRKSVVLQESQLEQVPLTAYLYKGELGLSLSAMVGMQTFAAGEVSDDYIGGTPIFSLQLSYQGLFHYALGVAMDLSFAHTREEKDLVNTSYTQRNTRFQAGLSLPWRFDSGSFSLALGPRVAFLFVARNKEFDGDELGTDHVPMWVAGAMTRMAWRLRALPISIGIDGRLSYVSVPTVEHGNRNEMLVETQASAGFHF